MRNYGLKLFSERKKKNKKKTTNRTCIQIYNIKGIRRPRTYRPIKFFFLFFSLFTGDGARRDRRFLAAFKIPQVWRTESFEVVVMSNALEFMGLRTDLHPLFLMSEVTWGGHLLPQSTWRRTGTTSTCSCARPSCGSRFCLLFCAWRGGSGTRSWLASRTDWGKSRSLCAEVSTGTCWRWTPFPTPGAAYWWTQCACACCSEVDCCYSL